MTNASPLPIFLNFTTNRLLYCSKRRIHGTVPCARPEQYRAWPLLQRHSVPRPRRKSRTGQVWSPGIM